MTKERVFVIETKHPINTHFEAGHGYTQDDWDAVDSPELTDAEIANMRLAKEVLPINFFENLAELRKIKTSKK